MNSIKLSTRYRLYSFSDYRSMQAAVPYMQRVALAKNLQDVNEREVRRYLGRSHETGFYNYLEPLTSLGNGLSASQSFITALQQLYKHNGFSARYIIIERL